MVNSVTDYEKRLKLNDNNKLYNRVKRHVLFIIHQWPLQHCTVASPYVMYGEMSGRRGFAPFAVSASIVPYLKLQRWHGHERHQPCFGLLNFICFYFFIAGWFLGLIAFFFSRICQLLCILKLGNFRHEFNVRIVPFLF